MLEKFSLERIIPDQLDIADDFDRATLGLHKERYEFAIQNGRPGYILDIACGSGYGSDQIIKTHKYTESRIVAVDIDEQTIAYARNRYPDPAIHFVCADALLYTDSKEYDTIVSLETIEHLKESISFVKKLYSLLKPDGVLIVSAPVTPSTDGNPHHLSDFSTAEFRRLFESNGWIISNQFMQIQPFSPGGILYSKNNRLAKRRQGIAKYYFSHPRIFFSRIKSLFVHGFNNKYLTLVLQKDNIIHSAGHQ